MPFIRFNQIFWLLMALAFTSAFILPRFSATENIGTKASAQVRGLFAPISFPLHRLGTWTYSALFADASPTIGLMTSCATKMIICARSWFG